MNCSQCSNPLTPNAKFCKNCGARKDTSAAETAPVEKICGGCQAVCKPQARFCPQCGTVFGDSAAATPEQAASAIAAPIATTAPAAFAMPAVTAVPETHAAPVTSIARTEPPLIEPMDWQAAPPAASAAVHTPVNAPVNAPIFPARHGSPPAFPQEPARSSKTWIKWAVLALIGAAIVGGMLMANNMKSLSSANNIPAASQAGKDSVSPEDKAKADALVGPQGGNPATPAETVNDPSSVTIAPPAPQIPPPPVINPAPVINTGPELAPPQAAPAAPSVAPSKPAPMKVQPAKKSGGPSLNDLLD